MNENANDIFNDCVRLQANDKISTRNAWDLKLIDCID